MIRMSYVGRQRVFYILAGNDSNSRACFLPVRSRRRCFCSSRTSLWDSRGIYSRASSVAFCSLLTSMGTGRNSRIYAFQREAECALNFSSVVIVVVVVVLLLMATHRRAKNDRLNLFSESRARRNLNTEISRTARPRGS